MEATFIVMRIMNQIINIKSKSKKLSRKASCTKNQENNLMIFLLIRAQGKRMNTNLRRNKEKETNRMKMYNNCLRNVIQFMKMNR